MIYHIILKPDIFLKNQMKTALCLLNDEHIDIYACSLIKPSQQLLDTMYLSDFKWEYDYLQHNLQLYELGPSLSLICDIKHETIRNIRAFKGSSLPSHLTNDSIRGRLGVKDRCINSIHIADTEEKSLEEIKMLYHTDNIILSPTHYLFYEQIKKLLLDFIFENYSLNQSDISASIVLHRLLHRIHYYISTCITLGYQEYNNSFFSQLVNFSNSAQQNFNKLDLQNKLRFFDLFWKLLDINMIYYSDFERYYIQSGILYYEVNT